MGCILDDPGEGFRAEERTHVSPPDHENCGLIGYQVRNTIEWLDLSAIYHLIFRVRACKYTVNIIGCQFINHHLERVLIKARRRDDHKCLYCLVRYGF